MENRLYWKYLIYGYTIKAFASELIHTIVYYVYLLPSSIVLATLQLNSYTLNVLCILLQQYRS